MKLALGALAALLTLVALPAIAAAPPNADPALAPWFTSLHNARGAVCCGLGDGHVLAARDVRIAGNGYEIRVAGAWYPVDPEIVLERVDNPTGAYVAFYSTYYDANPGLRPTVYCFVRPADI